MRAVPFETAPAARPAARLARNRLLDRLCTLPDASVTRRFSLASLALQFALSLLAGLSLVALHADGAWMTFAIADGDPWHLKWVHLASRATAYVGVVLPVQALAGVLGLHGRGIAIAYGFLFNFLQFAQAAVSVRLAWRRFPALLIFPLAQYLLSTALGYGFMSEAYLGPGFFWIALFLVLRGPPPVLPFAACFAGMVFSHELLLPAAALLAALVWLRRIGPVTRRDLVLLSLCLAVMLAWTAVRLSGGGADSDGNAITTLDPRRLVRNPTLWILLAAAAPILAVTRRRRPGPLGLAALAAACAGLPFLLAPWLNVADGRYDSARTLTGLECLLFGAWAVLAHFRRVAVPVSPRRDSRAAILLAVCFGVVAGADAAFLHQWTIARDGFARLATTGAASFLTPQHAGLTPREIHANDRLAFEWTWPFRSAMLADAAVPRTVIIDPPSLFYVCHVLGPASDEGTAPTRRLIARLRPIACAAPPPRPRRRLFRKIIDWL